MYMFARHRVFFRCVSLFTALTFLPTSVQAWYFLPEVSTQAGTAESVDLDSLLELESSLRTASEPRMPESPAQPFQLADANPVGVPAPPVPLRPDAQTPPVEGGAFQPPVARYGGGAFQSPVARGPRVQTRPIRGRSEQPEPRHHPRENRDSHL